MSESNGPNFSAGDKIIGKKSSYHVIQSMGGGAFAKPYLVENIDNHTKLILKFNTKVNEAEIVYMVAQTFIERNEVPLVVDVIDYPLNEFKGWWGHIEALAEGQTCYEKKPNELQALYILLDFARLLKYCAKKGVAYLDIKPLTHIFWRENEETHKPVIKVIDWNAGTKGAPFHKLRRDLLEFCRSMPELFTGQEIEKFKLNPLYWNLDYSANSQLPITYATWIMLASLSLDWAGPTIPEVKDVLQLPNSSMTSRNAQPIIEAWDAIIVQIQNTIDRNIAPTGQDFNPGFSPSPRLKIKTGFETIAKALKIEHPSDMVTEMEFQAQEITLWLKENKDFIAVNRPDYEAAILALRLLCPANQQFAILLSAFEIWKNAAHISHLIIDPDWQKFIKAIVESDFYQLTLIKQNDLPRMKENILARSEFSENDRYAEEWVDKLSALEEEINIWATLNAGNESDILALPSSHPIIKNKHFEIKKRQTTNQDFESHKRQLEEAYRSGDFAKITNTLSEIENSKDVFSAEQLDQLANYRDAVQIFNTIQSLSNSWNQDDLQKWNVLYAFLPDEKKAAFENYVKIASAKQKLLSDLSSLYFQVDDNLSIEQASLLNVSKYLVAADTKQYKDVIKALKRWAQKQYENLQLSVSNGLRENRLDRELVQNAIAQAADLQKLAGEINLNDLVSELKKFASRLKEDEVGIDKFLQHVEGYRSRLKRDRSDDPQDTQAQDDFQKLPEELRDILKHEVDREVKLVEAIKGTLNTEYANFDQRLNENQTETVNEIKKIQEANEKQVLDFENKLKNGAKQFSAESPMASNKLPGFLKPALQSVMSIFLTVLVVVIFIIISRGMRQTQEDMEALAEFQHEFATAMIASPLELAADSSPIQTETSQPGISSATPEVIATPNSGASNPVEITTPGVANPTSIGNTNLENVPFSPFQLGFPFSYETGQKAVNFSNDMGEVIFRTQDSVATLDLYLIKEDTTNQSKYVGLFAFVLDKNIQDILAPKYTIKNSVFLYSPADVKTELLVIIKPPLEVFPISTDSANAGHIVWLEGWIK